jgi:hypothetical protein
MAKVYLFGDFQNERVLALERMLQGRDIEVVRTKDPENVSVFGIVCFSGGFEGDDFVERLRTRQLNGNDTKLIPVVLTGGVVPFFLQHLFRLDLSEGAEDSRSVSTDPEMLIRSITRTGRR